ncbi:MAG TPA: hypothetical protein VLX59_11540 [Acidimicrobiales bacterium]|nr:hypothetical protein [Acidimicrobiales bacterium]
MALTLDDSARLAGGHCWLERRLFEVLGGWVGSTPEPAVKLLFDRHSGHHAWRAGQWWERLPVLADVDRQSLVAPEPAGLAEIVDMLAAASSPAARLAGTYRFALPRLWSRYAHHLSLTGAAADGSSIRTLEMVMTDVGADWRQGEVLLQGMLRQPELVRAASHAVAQLETRLAVGNN